jgi:hypothetical protein
MTSEANLLKQIILSVQIFGGRLFRNQVGRYKVGDRWISSGLCVGSSDLIGWTPIKIHAGMVGRTIAVFTAVEVKGPRGRLRPEQVAFIACAKVNGALVCCAQSVEDVEKTRTAFLG